MLTCSLGSQALANAKIALLSVAVFAPAAAVMIGNSYLSKHFKERNFHGGVPVVISGIAFLVLPVAIFRGGVVAGFIMLIIAAAGAWAVHGPLWCVSEDVYARVLLAAGHLSLCKKGLACCAGRGRRPSWWAPQSRPASHATMRAERQGASWVPS